MLGGLSPNRLRFVLDALTLGFLVQATFTPVPTIASAVLFAVPYILTLLTAGTTSRWTLTFPMVPLLLLQLLRYIPQLQRSPRWVSVTIMSLSLLIIAASAALCIFFPALELPVVKGPYEVGVIDFYLPIKQSESDSCAVDESTTTKIPSHVPVRVMYPTLDKPEGIPYLNPRTATEFCRETMRFGAPPPLKGWGWFLHSWTLMRLPATKQATLLQGSAELPVVFYSHGLGSTYESYSYQTMAVAAQGSIVVCVNHSDGSAPAIQQHDGSILTYDHSLVKLWVEGEKDSYVRKRRDQADHRARELVGVADAFLEINDLDNSDLKSRGISFLRRLDKQQCTFMGHSFGGATALIAGTRRPDLVRSIVAHEPAVDWMTDDARRALFAERVMENLTHKYTGGTGGYEFDHKGELQPTLHDLDVLIMYSEEWSQINWGESHLVEAIFKSGRLGHPEGNSHYEVIPGAHHMEFSDVGMLTPLWLARITGAVGQNNPVETALEIQLGTVKWMEQSRSRRHSQTKF